MYEFQRRLLNEAAKFGKLSPKETINLPEECRDFVVEGVSVMSGAEKLAVSSGNHTAGDYRKLLKALKDKGAGHALALDHTTPTGPGAARGGLTGEESEMKVVKISEIGKMELRGYSFPSMKVGAKATRTWKDHKGEATILAINESVEEEVEHLEEGAVKDELETFLYGLPNPVVTALKKMGDLKGKEKDIRALLIKHKAKLIFGMKSRKPSMNESIKVIVYYFADMFQESAPVDEAYAPQWAYNQRKIHPILGQFKHSGVTTEYRAIDDKNPGAQWAKSHGLTHEIFLQPVWGNYSDTRFAIVKGSVVHVAVDEGEGGKPVIEKWPITSHKKYPLPNG